MRHQHPTLRTFRKELVDVVQQLAQRRRLLVPSALAQAMMFPEVLPQIWPDLLWLLSLPIILLMRMSQSQIRRWLPCSHVGQVLFKPSRYGTIELFILMLIDMVSQIPRLLRLVALFHSTNRMFPSLPNLLNRRHRTITVTRAVSQAVTSNQQQ